MLMIGRLMVGTGVHVFMSVYTKRILRVFCSYLDIGIYGMCYFIIVATKLQYNLRAHGHSIVIDCISPSHGLNGFHHNPLLSCPFMRCDTVLHYILVWFHTRAASVVAWGTTSI